MGDDPIIVCCILGLCCPVGSLQQRRHLARAIRLARPHLSENQALDAAQQVLTVHNHFRAIR